VKVKTAVSALPPPAVRRGMSLGYPAALADYLWAHVLVTQGLRASERRPFDYVEQYLDAINDLAPKFREPYRLADSILVMQIGDPDREGSVRAARRILERGLKELPYDAELWLNYGQFLAYLAPGSLHDAEERKAWRSEGARALARVADLAGADENVLARSMSAATLLTRYGERDAAIRFLDRAYAMTDSEDARAEIQQRLNVLLRGKRASRQFVFVNAFDSLWRESLPFGSRAMLSVIGPAVRSWDCAGPRAQRVQPNCQRDWSAWSSSLDVQPEPP
jgi:tetratricopeptide (TPR) repeat protein